MNMRNQFTLRNRLKAAAPPRIGIATQLDYWKYRPRQLLLQDSIHDLSISELIVDHRIIFSSYIVRTSNGRTNGVKVITNTVGTKV
jgi:hypothetical protein